MVADREINGPWRAGLCTLGHIQIYLIDWLIVHNGGTGGIGCEEEKDPELSHSSFHLSRE